MSEGERADPAELRERFNEMMSDRVKGWPTDVGLQQAEELAQEAIEVAEELEEEVERLRSQQGRPAKRCAVCGDERPERRRASVAGKKRPVCASCDEMDPAERRERFERGVEEAQA